MTDAVSELANPADYRNSERPSRTTQHKRVRKSSALSGNHITGASETRTRDLLHAMQTRSQLRHGPVTGHYGKPGSVPQAVAIVVGE